MKYFTKMQLLIAGLLVILISLAVPVMANNNSPVTPPKIISLAPVSLSDDLREKYSEQTILVKVKATVSAIGIIDSDIRIITSSGDALFDQAVIDSMQQSVFSPAYTSDNQAVACSILFPLQVNVEKYVPEEQVNNEETVQAAAE